MTYVYPAVFHPEAEGGFFVYFPDIARGATQGETVAECIKVATDFLCLALYDMEEDNIPAPLVSDSKSVQAEPTDIVTLISADTEDYRRYFENKAVKKTLTIPMWLNKRAEEANINFSKLLQQALKSELQISDQR